MESSHCPDFSMAADHSDYFVSPLPGTFSFYDKRIPHFYRLPYYLRNTAFIHMCCPVTPYRPYYEKNLLSGITAGKRFFFIISFCHPTTRYSCKIPKSCRLFSDNQSEIIRICPMRSFSGATIFSTLVSYIFFQRHPFPYTSLAIFHKVSPALTVYVFLPKPADAAVLF